MSKNPDDPKTKLSKQQIQDAVTNNSGKNPNHPVIGSQAYTDKKAANQQNQDKDSK